MPTGLCDLKPGCELALLDNDAVNPIVGYWKVKAIHDGGVELWDASRERILTLVLDEYGQATQNVPGSPE